MFRVVSSGLAKISVSKPNGDAICQFLTECPSKPPRGIGLERWTPTATSQKDKLVMGVRLAAVAFGPFQKVRKCWSLLTARFLFCNLMRKQAPFSCAPSHARRQGRRARPENLTSSDYLLKGYSSDERIIYGTERITPVEEVSTYADALLNRPDVAFVDLRSARNNCWQARLTSEQ